MMWLGWQIIAAAAADNAAAALPGGKPPTESAAASVLATAALAQLTSSGQVDIAAAQRQAREALDVDPLDVRALVLLGMAAERLGERARAARLMEIAGERSWRDPLGQAWLFDHELQQHDFAAAASHADAMLRTDPSFETQLFPALAAFTTSPEGMNTLVRLLSSATPWRGRFLQQFSVHATDIAPVAKLFGRLQAGAHPPSTEDMVYFLGRLVLDGRYQEAAAYWRARLPPEQRSRLDEYPFNGDFALPMDGLPFNWAVRSVRGADIQVVPAPAAPGNALRVEFSGARVDFHNVVQLMMLPPGSYRFGGQVKASDLQSRRGLWWRIDCAEQDGAGNTLGHTGLVVGTEPWTSFETTFTVPPSGCAAQWLRLEVPARIDPERDISGEVWYRALRIVPDSDSHGSPP